MVAPERLTEPRVTMELLLAIPRSFSNLPTFLDLDGRYIFNINSKLRAQKNIFGLYLFVDKIT